MQKETYRLIEMMLGFYWDFTNIPGLSYNFGTSITGAPHQPPASIGMTPLTGRNVDRDGVEVDDPWPAMESPVARLWAHELVHFNLKIPSVAFNMILQTHLESPSSVQIRCCGESW